VNPQQRPRREVVRSERTPGRTGARPNGDRVPADPRAVELMRRQLTTAAISAAALLVLVGSLPLDFALVPGLAAVRVAGVGIAWILLGVLVYPVLLLIGRLHLGRAERNESAVEPLEDGR
jgi:hypothetical protein